MEVRTYYVTTVEAAFALARREFGAEAMLMQSTRIDPDSKGRGQYEVVFAGEPVVAPVRTPVENSEALQTRAVQPSLQEVSTRFIWPTLGSSTPGIVRPAKVSMEDVAFRPIDLVRNSPGLHSAFATPPLLAGSDEASIKKSLRLAPAAECGLSRTYEPSLRITCNPGLSSLRFSSYTVALAGPTGSGKTTTAMKLAVRYGLMAASPCRLIAYDPERVGATERLRHFASLLKIPFESVETSARLSSAISLSTPGLTIVDTPGCAPADDSVLAGLAFLLRAHRSVETQLVLRADRKVSVNIAAAVRLSALAPKRLVLTALDEANDYGELEALFVGVGLPLSFLGTGQKIPDDLEPASLGRLEGLVHHGWSETQAAAA